MRRCFVQLCDIIIWRRKCWLTLLERKTRETLKRGQKTHNSKFSLVVILRRKNAKFCIHKVDLQKPKKEERKNSLVTPHFSSSIALCFLSFFLSFSAATKPEFFLLFARAKTERERLREAFEKAFFDYSFYLYEHIKGRRRWKFFFNDAPHF